MFLLCRTKGSLTVGENPKLGTWTVPGGYALSRDVRQARGCYCLENWEIKQWNLTWAGEDIAGQMPGFSQFVLCAAALFGFINPARSLLSRFLPNWLPSSGVTWICLRGVFLMVHVRHTYNDPCPIMNNMTISRCYSLFDFTARRFLERDEASGPKFFTGDYALNIKKQISLHGWVLKWSLSFSQCSVLPVKNPAVCIPKWKDPARVSADSNFRWQGQQIVPSVCPVISIKGNHWICCPLSSVVC